jgi:hypothetical protein
VERQPDGYILTAETYGDGAEMFLRSQGDAVKKLERAKNS